MLASGILAVALTTIYAVYVLFFARQKSRGGLNLADPANREDVATLDYVNLNHGVTYNGQPIIIKNWTDRP